MTKKILFPILILFSIAFAVSSCSKEETAASPSSLAASTSGSSKSNMYAVSLETDALSGIDIVPFAVQVDLITGVSNGETLHDVCQVEFADKAAAESYQKKLMANFDSLADIFTELKNQSHGSDVRAFGSGLYTYYYVDGSKLSLFVTQELHDSEKALEDELERKLDLDSFDDEIGSPATTQKPGNTQNRSTAISSSLTVNQILDRYEAEISVNQKIYEQVLAGKLTEEQALQQALSSQERLTEIAQQLASRAGYMSEGQKLRLSTIAERMDLVTEYSNAGASARAEKILDEYEAELYDIVDFVTDDKEISERNFQVQLTKKANNTSRLLTQLSNLEDSMSEYQYERYELLENMEASIAATLMYGTY